MANFLNAGILGDGAGVANKRGFRSIATQYIDAPTYNAKYFETYPTVWASAYAFGKMLAAESDPRRGPLPSQEQLIAIEAATHEWVSLFLLLYYGDLHVVSYDRPTLENEYDKDLWIALSGTFPIAGEHAVSEIQLLETDAHTVVGGYYSETVLFPSRGRSRWRNDAKLAPYLDGTRLSWKKCSTSFLKSEGERRDFHGHLQLIARLLPSKVFQDRLRQFCSDNFFGDVEPVGSLPANITGEGWTRHKEPPAEDFLRHYPLQKPNEFGGTTYYLVSGIASENREPWMTAATSVGPAPFQYTEPDRTFGQIMVPFRGKNIVCTLGDNDRVAHLSQFLLSDAPFWCKVPKLADENVYHVKSLHKIELRDSVLTESDVAVCLAPLSKDYLRHFPEILDQLDQIRTTTDWQGASVEWSFPITDKDGVVRSLKWKTRPMFARALSATSLRIWPPRESPDWHLYAAYGIGKKKDCGRWHLVDEEGRTGEPIEINEEEYFSVLRPDDKPASDGELNEVGQSGRHPRYQNRPRALMLSDNDNRERGVLFLLKFQTQTTSGDGRATLAVDFGTSNTCLAFNDGDSQVLNFKLTPEMLWGKRQPLESPGFVPFEWGGQKGFFPTILLSRLSDPTLRDDLRPDQIKLHHLFKVDIPGLHKGMEERLNVGEFNKVWKPHTNLKWETSGTRPWRTLFLELTMLYAHAELFFRRGVKPDTYAFTFPRAFPLNEQDIYHSKVQVALRKIRHYCYGSRYTDFNETDFIYKSKVDESTAIAEQIRSHANPALMDVFVDIGGGTADIAIRHNGHYLVLDSIRVAGESFFRFAEKNFNEKHDLHGAPAFKRQLRRLLQGQDDDAPYKILNPDKEFRLGVTYSVAINALDDAQFREREAAILKETKGTRSYQKYRSKLFLRHIITYALVQACAAVIEGKLKLSSGLKLVLGGNGWGLMVFAGMPRSAKRLTEEATEILKLLKRELSETLDDEERACLDTVKTIHLELLNESDLSAAKTSVALGALKASAKELNSEQTVTPFAGVTIKNLQINKKTAMTARWCDRWGFEEFKSRYGFMDNVESVWFDRSENQEKPMDSLLSVFTCVGNTSTNTQDNMPGDVWISLNSELSAHINETQGDRVEQVPINYFISDILYPRDSTRDFLDTLAAKNGQYRTNSDEE
jgi:hypothetical protein